MRRQECMLIGILTKKTTFQFILSEYGGGAANIRQNAILGDDKYGDIELTLHC